MFGDYFKKRAAFKKHYGEGMRLLDLKDYGKARDELLEASRIDRDDEYVLINLGQAYIELDQAEAALEVLDRGIELASPVNPVPLIMKGYALYRLDRIEEAMAVLRNALKIDIKHPAVYYYMALCALRKNKLEEASEYMEEVVAEKPTFAAARLLAIAEKYIQDRAIAAKQKTESSDDKISG